MFHRAMDDSMENNTDLNDVTSALRSARCLQFVVTGVEGFSGCVVFAGALVGCFVVVVAGPKPECAVFGMVLS